MLGLNVLDHVALAWILIATGKAGKLVMGESVNVPLNLF